AGVLWAAAVVGLAGAVGLGLAGVSVVGIGLLPFIAAGVLFVFAYNLELLGGRLHGDFWFALSWGAFPVLTAYFAQTGRVSVSAVPGDQRRTQLLRLDDIVDDQVCRQLVKVDVFAVLVLELPAFRVPLRLWQVGELVEEDRVDGRLRTHDSDLRGRKRDHRVGVERRPRHRVEAGPVSLADDDRDLRHRGLGDGADHLGAMPDDAALFDVGADHEAGHVSEEKQRDLKRIAKPDEARPLVRGIVEEDTPLLHRLVGDDADRLPVEPREPDQQLLGEQLFDLQPAAFVDDRVDDLAHVVAAIGLFGDQLTDRLRRGLGRFRLARRRLFAGPLRHVLEVRAGEFDRGLVIGNQRIAQTTLGGVHPRAAQLLERGLFSDHDLEHPRRAG